LIVCQSLRGPVFAGPGSMLRIGGPYAHVSHKLIPAQSSQMDLIN